MDTKKSTTLITRFLDALNAADIEAVLACLHEDIVQEVGDERQFGRDAFRFHLGARARRFDEQIGDIVVMASADGTRAAAEFTRRGRLKMAGATGDAGDHYSVAAGMFFAIEDGVIVRITPHNFVE